MLLASVIAVAVSIGLRAGVVAAAVSTLLVWYEYTGSRHAFDAPSTREAVGLAAYAVATAGVLELLRRVDRERRRSARERRVSEALLDGAPVGIGMFDTDLRFASVNRRLAEIDGLPAEAHLGRRPAELHPMAGELYESLLAKVRDERTPVLDELLSMEFPDSGVERHWRAGYYPVSDDDGRLLGIGAAIEEVTGDVVSRRRSARLLELARELSATVDRRSFNATMTTFLADVFRGRAFLAFVEEDGRTLRCSEEMVGYPPEVEAAWSDLAIPLEAVSPIADACRLRSPVAVGSERDFDQRYPDLASHRAISGDRACFCVPVEEPGSGRVSAVLVVAWPHDRVATDTTRTLASTVASLSALALKRIQLAEELDRDRFRSALDSMLDHVAIARSERDEHGRIVDFRIEFANAPTVDGAGRTADQLMGQRVTEIYPAWRSSGFFDRFAEVVNTGVPFVSERMPYHDVVADGTEISGHWSIQVVRFGDGYMAASRDVSEVVRLEEAEREARRLADREQLAVQMLQTAALPARLPELPGVTMRAVYQPAVSAQPVGGDWHDAFTVDDDRVALVIADVAGHGPDAAAFMVQVRNIVRAIASEHCTPDEVLRRVNDVTIGLHDPAGLFVTCCFALLDLTAGTFSWSSAGHPPPLLCRRGGCDYLVLRPNLPLAVAAGAAYTSQCETVGAGDRLVLFTDGLVERRGESIDDGLERLRGLLDQVAGKDVDTALSWLVDTVEPQGDDLAVLLVDLSDPG
jgi:PAS domain S-box-containing protein